MNKKSASIVPAALTSGNLFFGFLSIVMAVQEEFLIAGWLVVIAAILDGLDGKIARLVSKGSRFGVEFDSLADLVSFGAAPAVLAYQIYFNRFGFLGVVIVFFIVLCGALRLARYNVDNLYGLKSYYLGLPIPISAITFVTFIHFNYRLWGEMRLDFLFTPLIASLCFLMISHIQYERIPRLTLKDTRQNLFKLLFLLIALISVAILPDTLFFPLCLTFIMHGVIRSVVKSLRKSALKRLTRGGIVIEIKDDKTAIK
jgi:CDP-diacylglycerol--serine O-phosphatidyltransferase